MRVTSGRFYEVSGVLGPDLVFGSSGAPVPGDSGRIVLSNLQRGNVGSMPHGAASLKYVAAGVEVYRYDGKTYPVSAGQFLYVPEQISGDVEIGRSPNSPLVVFRAPDGAVVVNGSADPVQVSPDTEPVAGWATTVIPRNS